MMMSGDTISAADALRLGLVNRVVPHLELESETDRMVARFVRNSPRIIAMIKRAVYKSLNAGFDQMLDYETAAQTGCFELEESAEGLNAFLEKRAPKFD
jgi:enoyl-CoA hydratase/carnithine racemase